MCPNHCRPSDPMLMGLIVKEAPCHIYAMASWHIFKQSRLEGFIANRCGGFSIYREGLDRQALDCSVQIVSEAERPLVIFPEGVISRSNDRLLAFMDGVSFIARAAAKKRARTDGGKVVVHPISVRYHLTTDPVATLSPVLSKLEQRTFWKSHEHLPLLDRIAQLGQALLAAREIECLGQPQSGSMSERMSRLIDFVLHPQEREWLGSPRYGDVIGRVKDLRIAIVPTLIQGKLDPMERSRRWRQLTDSYYLQCLSMYPPQYLDCSETRGPVTPERISETVHRLEEDMTDSVSIRPEWHVDLRIGEAIEVDPNQKKSRSGDVLMQTLRSQLLSLLNIEDWWPPAAVTLEPRTKAETAGAADGMAIDVAVRS